MYSENSGSSAVLQPTSFHSPSNLLQSNVSKIAQESLREVKRLRILLTRLLATVETSSDDACEDVDQIPDEVGKESGGVMQATGAVGFTAAGVSSDGTLVCGSIDQELLGSDQGKCLSEPLRLQELVTQISNTLDSLDQLASRFHTSRLSTRVGEWGLINALSLLTTVDQLDFSSSFSSIGEFGESAESCQLDLETRRTDWLTDRTDAERWSNRYWERTHTILEGLLACSVFRRSHLNSDTKRHRLDSWSSSARDFRVDLEHLLSDIHYSCPKMTITQMESGSNVIVVHVRVGDVMQCFVTFRRIHPERIVVRGITECMQVKSAASCVEAALRPSDFGTKTLSKPLDELLCTKSDLSGSTKDTIISLLVPDTSVPAYHETRTRRCGGISSQQTQRSVSSSPVSIQQLDLVTPSSFVLFRRITSLAQCAILHFSNDYQPPSAVRGFFLWLHSYHDLFTAPCTRCGQLLGQDVSLPLWRSYPQLRKDENRSMEAQHEHCQTTG